MQGWHIRATTTKCACPLLTPLTCAEAQRRVSSQEAKTESRLGRGVTLGEAQVTTKGEFLSCK